MVNITPKTWYQVSASRLDSVGPSPVPGGNIVGVMDAWSGGAFDSIRDKLIVWGGGHTDYAGNEIYAFSLSALTWNRIRDPVLAANEDPGSPGTYESTGYYANGSGSYDPQQPRSRHTYSSLQYISATDKFIAFGGIGFYQGGQTTSNHVFIYSVSGNTWTSGVDIPTPIAFQMPTAWDPVTSTFYMYGGGNQGYLVRYSVSGNSWTSYGDIFNGSSQVPNGSAYLTGVIDPIKRRFFAFGNGVALFWPLSGTGTIDAVNIASRITGSSGLHNAQAPGLDYDPISGCVVGWAGGSTVYIFDSETFAVSTVTLDAGNSVTPTAANTQGTFGRFRYSPKSNVYIGVNKTNENVYLFKLNADPGGGSGTSITATVPVVSAAYSLNKIYANWDKRNHKTIKI